MATLVTRIADLALRIATECKSLRTLINGNAADLSSLQTTAKSNLVAALNELKADLDDLALAGGAVIDDSETSSLTETWSITKISTEIAAAVAGLVDSAPGVLDTLNELAAALGDDANFATTVNNALAKRLRFDAAQTLTAGEKTQACANLGIGEPDTNFVTGFETGLV